MKETNRKVLLSVIATLIITLFAAWLMFAPSSPDPNVTRVSYPLTNGNFELYYVVTVDEEQWATKTTRYNGWKTDWVSLETGEIILGRYGPRLFGTDSQDLSKIIDMWNRQNLNEKIRTKVNKILKGD